ncbi:MAG: hypothetical protein AAFR14_09985 [Bacteroidota bacterium]
MKRYIVLIFTSIFLVSCDQIIDPSLERIEQVDVVDMSPSRLEVNAVMVFQNDNPFALQVSGTDMIASVDSIPIATIRQAYDTEMQPKAEFDMPVHIVMDLQELYADDPLGAISKGLKILSDRRLDVRFEGSLKVGKGAAKISVPYNQVEVVKF